VSIKTQTSLNALALAVDCDTAETVRWEIAETLDKCSGTKQRILEQIRAGEDCDTCPPGFLAVVMQTEKLSRALGIALDLLGVPTIDGSETA
jgi:transposase